MVGEVVEADCTPPSVDRYTTLFAGTVNDSESPGTTVNPLPGNMFSEVVPNADAALCPVVPGSPEAPVPLSARCSLIAFGPLRSGWSLRPHASDGSWLVEGLLRLRDATALATGACRRRTLSSSRSSDTTCQCRQRFQRD